MRAPVEVAPAPLLAGVESGAVHRLQLCRRQPTRARVGGQEPLRAPLVEAPALGDVVAGVHVRLHPEQVLRVAQVRLEVLRHLVEVGEQVRERRPVRPDERVLRVDDVELHRAVVGVDRRLHRVAHVIEFVVETGVARPRRHLRVRVTARRGVRVEDPRDAAAADDRVRIGVEVEERGELLHPVLDVADVQDLRAPADLPRDERVDVAEAQREGSPTDRVVEFDPVLALVARRRVGATGT